MSASRLGPIPASSRIAFSAQFINPDLPHLLVLIITSTIVMMGVLILYALLASKVSEKLQAIRARQRLAYAGGSCLLGGSALKAVHIRRRDHRHRSIRLTFWTAIHAISCRCPASLFICG